MAHCHESGRFASLASLVLSVFLVACGSTTRPVGPGHVEPRAAEHPLAAADAAWKRAVKSGDGAAAGDWLDCATLAHGAMADASGPEDAMTAASLATRCTDGFLNETTRTRRVWNVGGQRVGRSNLKVVLRDASPHLRGPFRIVQAARVSMAMYRGQRNLRPGFGVPVVLLAPRCTDEPVCGLLPPSGVFRWATAWMDVDPEDGAPRLVLAHPVRSNPVHIGGRSWELAVDSSAFYAAGLQDSPIKRLSLWGVFGGRELGRRAGVYLLEDYDPRKRPLVMIHGLGSSPLAWARLSNAVWADPELRRRYQVWQLVYQTNDPILIARLRVQEQLDAAWTILDPEGDDPARENMVLVGHSMGGVVSRLLISESRDQLWEAAFAVPPSGLAGDRADIAALDRLFRFTPYPGIRRAILIAAPHGGSPTADGFLGRMANALAGRRAPEIEALRRVAAANEQAVREELRSAYLQGKISSITTLRSTQPVMRAAQALPTAPDVPYHTIAGHQAGTDPPGDGVVPLDSAVLPGSTSVLVVPSGHNVHEQDEAIEEVLRILYQPRSGGWVQSPILPAGGMDYLSGRRSSRPCIPRLSRSHDMKVSLLGVALLASFSLSSAAQEAGHPAHWGYAGEVGPDHWAQFESDFGTCSSGRNQSPIDLTGFIDADLPGIVFDYRPGGYQVVNNGHAIQVNFNPGSSITVDATVFELKQVHFHSPSENTIKGRSFPMEAHFVHADAKGNLAVVALMFEEGRSNAALAKVWPNVPMVENGQSPLSPVFDANGLLQANRDYYRYNGSLTTPPCSEGVRWFVLKHAAQATSGQLGMVGKAIGHPNNRPVQPLGARPVLD